MNAGGALMLHGRQKSAPLAMPATAAELGPLMTPLEIAEQILGRAERAKWVRQHMPKEHVITIGRERLMYEADARAWILSLRGSK